MTQDTRTARKARPHGKRIHEIGTILGSISAGIIAVYEFSIDEGTIGLAFYLGHVALGLVAFYLFTRLESLRRLHSTVLLLCLCQSQSCQTQYL